MQFWPILKDAGLPVLVSAGIIALSLLLMKTQPGRRSRERAAAWCAVRIRFRYWALARYRREILARDGKVRPPFAAEATTLSHVYVDRTPTDADAASMEDQLGGNRAGSPGIVVTGDPGAGKSLLLQSLLHGWALADRDSRGAPVPVRVELSRLDPDSRPEVPHPLDDDGDLYPLHRALIDFLADRGVEHGRRFVLHGLRTGRLSVLCDGLDEVPRDREAKVRALLERARDRYPRCRFTVTCRAAVYRDRLPGFDEVTLAGFTPGNIDEFLNHWAERPGVSRARIERLRTELANGGLRVRQLAQSPLLLTFMAHTYGRDTMGSPLTGSRSAFYGEVTGFLLDFKTDKRFSVDVKRIALEKLACKAITAPGQALRYREVMGELKQVLEIPGLSVELADELLEDLLHRTGMLSKLSARGEYQFAHLNLLEYFAARSFGDDTAELLRRYQADPDTWRESMRLWAGYTRADLAPVIAEAAEADLGLALECLADSGFDDLPEEMLDRAIDALLTDSIVRSVLSGIAADHPLLGEQVRGRLMSHASEVDGPGAEAAVAALTASEHPDAARFIRFDLPRTDANRLAFTSMGDVAADVLCQVYTQLKAGDRDSTLALSLSESLGYDEEWGWWTVMTALIDEIAAIGTPSSLRCLVECLDNAPGDAKVRAAHHLARLVRQPRNEAVLRDLDCWEKTPISEAWTPFAAKYPPGFTRIMNRIAELLPVKLFPVYLPQPPNGDYLVDARLATYFVAEAAGRGMFEVGAIRFPERARRFPVCDRHLIYRISIAQIDALPADAVHGILLELLSAAENRSQIHPANFHEHWTWAMVDSLPEGAGTGILRLIRQAPAHDLETAWQPVQSRIRPKRDSGPARKSNTSWIFAALASSALALFHFLTAPTAPWLPDWFVGVAIAYGAMAVFSLALSNMEMFLVFWGCLTIFGVVPMGMVGWSQLADWFGPVWGSTVTTAVVAVLIAAAIGILNGSIDDTNLWFAAPAISFVALCCGIVVFRLITEPWGPVWIQWLAGTGAVSICLLILDECFPELTLERMSIASYLPLAVLAWFGFRDWVGPATATALAVAAFGGIASIVVYLEHRRMSRENPLYDVILELSGDGRPTTHTSTGHLSSLADKFRLSTRA